MQQYNLSNAAQNYSINHRPINNGVLGSGQMPGHFQSASADSLFQMDRKLAVETKNSVSYIFTTNKYLNAKLNKGRINKKIITQQGYKGGKLIGTDGDDRSSSALIRRKQLNHVGKSNYLHDKNNLAYSGMNNNDVNSAKRRTRSSGQRTPPKVSMLKNRVSCSYNCS